MGGRKTEVRYPQARAVEYHACTSQFDLRTTMELLDLVKNSLSVERMIVSTELGVRTQTHCVYPGFDPVCVYVGKGAGEGIRISDAGEAWEVAHRLCGISQIPSESLFRKIAKKHGIEFSAERSGEQFDQGPAQSTKRENRLRNGLQLKATIRSPDWLLSAILSVSNAAVDAVTTAIQHLQSTVEDEKIAAREIGKVLRNSKFVLEYEPNISIVGETGHKYKYDYRVKSINGIYLVRSQSAHGAAINASFRAFSDTVDFSNKHKWAVIHDELNPQDLALLQTVSTPVHFSTWEKSGGVFNA